MTWLSLVFALISFVHIHFEIVDWREGILLKLDVQGQGGGNILDVNGYGAWGSWKLDNLCIVPKHIVSLSQQIHWHMFEPDGGNTFAYKSKIHVRSELILFCFSTLKLDFFMSSTIRWWLSLWCKALFKYHNVYCSLPFSRAIVPKA